MLTDSFLNTLTSFRQELHRFPEVSNQEERTANRVVELAKSFHPDEIIENVGGYGVLVIFKGKDNGKTIAFRAELDALPIHEEQHSNVEYISKKKGVAHLCGHDGHMTMVLSLLEELSTHPIRKGKVVLLFQPAEETGEGAARMIEDRRFKGLSIDAIYGLHNIPGIELGKVLIRNEHFAAASKGLVIHFKGKTAHAAEPENGVNPAFAIAELVGYIRRLNENFESKDFAITTIVHLKVGKVTFGISPADGVLMLTLRSFLNEDMNALTANIQTKVTQLAQSEQLEFIIEETEVFPATINHEIHSRLIRSAAEKHQISTEELVEPFRWSEDFGHFLNDTNGAMFGLGSGKNQPALHHSNFDFPDELIPIGNRIYSTIIQLTNR